MRVACLIAGIATLLLMVAAEVLRQVYNKHRQESEDTAAALVVVALRDALRPIATAIADMQTAPKDRRRERADAIAHRGADALALMMARTPGFRSVVYREDAGGNALYVLAGAGRSEREPHEFRRGDERGDADVPALDSMLSK